MRISGSYLARIMGTPRTQSDWVDRINAFRGPGESVLDYGCGKGIKDRIPDILEYDPGVVGKDKRPRPADLVICTNVLEYVELDCLKDVLKDLRHLTLRMMFVVVSTKESPDYQIVKPADWWQSRLRNAGFEVYRHREPSREWYMYEECQFKCL